MHHNNYETNRLIVKELIRLRWKKQRFGERRSDNQDCGVGGKTSDTYLSKISDSNKLPKTSDSLA